MISGPAMPGDQAAGGHGRDADMLGRLAALRDEAAQVLAQHFRPMPDKRAGFVEAVAVDESGLVWVIGWIADPRTDCSMVVVDGGGKAAAGFASMLIPRDDLPPGASGLVAVLRTDWKPNRDGKAFFFLDGADGRYLEGLDSLTQLSKTALIQHCAPLWAKGPAGHAAELRRLIQHADAWDVLPPEFAPEIAAVEQVLVLPGFGCLATGWALSPTKQIEGLALRLGNVVLVSDPGSIVAKPRPDLAEIFPNADRLIERAGFTAAFPGQVDPDSLGDAMLKVVYRDGTASNHPIGAAAMRRLGESVSWDRVRLLYPSITAERFFPSFAAAVRAHHAETAEAVRPVAVAPCAEALVLAAPRDRSDAFLAFDGIARNAAQLPPGAGIVVLAGEDCDRSAVIALFDDLRDASDRPLSLMIVPEAAMAAYSLSAAARHIGFERFLFVGADAMLTPAGWEAAHMLDGALAFLDLLDPAHGDAAGELGFDVFAWSVSALRNWLAADAPRLGGPGLAPAALALGARRIAAGAARLHIPAPSPFVAAINAIGVGR